MTDADGSIVLLSGGFDSTAALFWAAETFGRPVHALTFEYGQRHWVEIERSRKIAGLAAVDTHTVMNTGLRAVTRGRLLATARKSDAPIDDPAAVVPGRNAVFLAAACAAAVTRRVPRVVIGCNADDAGAFLDCRVPTLLAVQRAMHLALGVDVQIVAPFIASTKRQVASTWMRHAAARPALDMSWSCYAPVLRGPHCNDLDACNACSACVKRADAIGAL
jgi:7-cyano-7-deazaguanine synthase